MLIHFDNMILNKNITLNLDYNVFYNFDNINLYQSLLNECKKKLSTNQEIKFDNISTKKKKKDDEDFISLNFLVSNLLNILNTENIKNNAYNKDNIFKKQKKKIDVLFKFKSSEYIEKKSENKLQINKNKYSKYESNDNIKNIIKNKSYLFNNQNIIHLCKNSYNKISNKISYCNIESNKKKLINCNKDFLYFNNFKNNKSCNFSTKNQQKIQNSIYTINSFKKENKYSFLKLNKKSINFFNNKKNIQWKKAISRQVLLSIFKKENKAEIHLKPNSLGSIYIKIKMKNNEAKLKLISNNTLIQSLLNNCIPFLKSSLMKNNIFLKKVNIFSSLMNHKNKNMLISKNYSKKINAIKNFYQDFKQNKFINLYA
ncbi:flagellar hook-length control protein FliK [Buchnera aphidicola]|uniref:flagellar hook-length control protein FliK n=1 Tax=Buchnera aphidicola TaxID=9 RepID=UPI003463E2AB